MAIIRFQPPFGGPESGLDRIRREIDRVFNQAGETPTMRDFSGVFPPVNVYEGEEHYLLTAELPGVDPSEVEITVTGDSMTIKGARRETEEGGERVSYHRRERGSGYFRRVLGLPDKVDAEKVEATSRHGVLHVTLPKAEEVKPRQIEVKPGE